jgi:protein tyrosine phosphatase (PTP) superfamily phosphohydrolase (DUF442 family)
MDTIFRGDVISPGGRRNAWLDALFVDHAVFRLIWTNFAAVVPGRLYRSNHPTPRRLALAARRHGIRTVVNLRGKSNNGADALSRAAAHGLGLRLIDVPMKSSRAPSRELVLELIEALRSGDEPILLHCKSGADRAGFAAGVFLLLNGGTSADALRELSVRYGHFRGSRTGILDAFFRRYRDFGEGHMPFEDWVRAEYDASALRHDGPVNPIARVLNDFVLRRE